MNPDQPFNRLPQDFFLLQLVPEMTMGFQVINQNRTKLINKNDHQLLYSKMSEYRKEESEQYKLKYEIEKKIIKPELLFENHLIKKESQDQAQLQESWQLTACLIYNKENEKDLDQKIEEILRNNERISQLVILVNGLKTLDPSHTFIHKSITQSRHSQVKIIFNSDDICYYFPIGTYINWFILLDTQDDYKLLQWVYQGIFKFFDTSFCFIANFEMTIDWNPVQDLLMQGGNRFAVQTSYELNSQKDSSQVFRIYYNYLLSHIQTGEIGKIKKFHTPFFCFYNWYLLERHVDEYMKQLYNANESKRLSTILPELMKQNKLEFFKSNLTTNMTTTWSLAESFKEVSDLQAQKALCNAYILETTSFDSFENSILIFIYFIKRFNEKTSLAFHVFLFMFAPYQLFHQTTDLKGIQVAISVIIPYFLIIFLIFFIFLPQQFQILSRRPKKQTIELLIQKNHDKINCVQHPIRNSRLRIQSNQNEVTLCTSNDNSLIYRKLNESMTYEKEVKIQVPDQNAKQFYKSNIQLQQRKGVKGLYKKIFKIFSVLTLCCIFLFIADFICTYALELQNPVRLATFIFIILFLVLQITKYFLAINQERKSSLLILFLQLIFCNLIVVQFTQIYHLLYYQKNPEQYCQRVGKLGEYLTLTFAIVLTFLLIESQTYYNGYMVLGVFAYYTFNNLIDLILQFITYLSKRAKTGNLRVEPI